MAMNDFWILHLSDLHIRNRGTKGNPTLDDVFIDMIKDIEVQLQTIKFLVIIVSGDICCCDTIPEHKEAIVLFFNKLKEIIPQNCTLLDFEIVPGNHDIKRPTKDNGFNDQSFVPKSDDYKELAREIHSVFQIEIIDSNLCFGVKSIEFNSKTICFLKIDTSWCDVAKRNNSFLGEHKTASQYAKKILSEVRRFAQAQKKVLYSQYNKVNSICSDKRHPIALTIAISHYPLTWITEPDNRDLKEFLLEQEQGLDFIDLWLCGHMHDYKMSYSSDNNHAITMLETGICTAENDQFPSSQRYSMYRISLERKVCAIQVRTSRNGRQFDNDDIIYTDVLAKKYNHFYFPLKTNSPGSFIHLNSANMSHSKCLYADDFILDLIKFISFRLNYLGYSLATNIADYKKIKDKEKQTDKEVYHLFVDFLKSMAGKVIDVVYSPYIDNNYSLLNEYPEIQAKIDMVNWRTHFRIYYGINDVSNDEYKSLYALSYDCPSPRPVPWNGLLQKAYKIANGTLVSSANDVENPINTKWDDFMTTIPSFKGNVLSLKQGNRPCITFGISSKADDFGASVLASQMLYALEFLNINNLLSYYMDVFWTVMETEFNGKHFFSCVSEE